MPLAEAGNLTLQQAAFFMSQEVYEDSTVMLMDFIHRALGGKQSLIPQRPRQQSPPAGRSAGPDTFAEPFVAAVINSPQGKAYLSKLEPTYSLSPAETIPAATATPAPTLAGVSFKRMVWNDAPGETGQ